MGTGRRQSRSAATQLPQEGTDYVKRPLSQAPYWASTLARLMTTSGTTEILVPRW